MPDRTGPAAPDRLAARRAGVRRGLPLAALAIGVGLLCALAYESRQNVANQITLVGQTRAVEHASRGLRDLLIAVQAADTSERGFLLTGEARYLAPYQKGIDAAVAALERARDGALRDGERERYDRLRAEVETKLDALRRSMALARAGSLAAAREIIHTDPYRGSMTRISERVTAWDAERFAALEARREEVIANARSLDRLGAGVFVLAMALLVVSGIATVRERSRRRAAEDESAAARAALSRANARLVRQNEAFIRAMKEVAYRYDWSSRLIRWQGDTDEVLGEDVSGSPMTLAQWHARIHPDDLLIVQSGREQRRRSTGVFTITFRLRQADGGWRAVEQRGVILRDEDGQGFETIGVIRDVSDAVVAEAEKAAMTQRFDALLGSIRDGFLAVDDAWTYVYVNETAAGMLMTPRDAMVGHNLWEVFPSARGLPFDHTCRRVMASGEPAVLEQYFALTSRWYRNHIYPFGTGLSIFLEDITDRKDAEHERDEARRRLAQFVGSLDRAVEAERTGIARAIHDELGQALTGLKYDIAWMQRRLAREEPASTDPILEHLAGMSRHIDDTVNRARRLARDLRPAMLNDLGLAASLRSHADEWSKRSGIARNCVTDAGRLPGTVETALYRIALEACTNILRHAQAQHAWLHLRAHDDGIDLEIGDDGIGFDPVAALRHDSLGLLGITERAALAGGEATIDAAPGRGTRIRVRIPAQALKVAAHEAVP
ncbi:MAG: CHASE3 domain-containing protein [Burkholderiales bacterium]